MALAQLDWIGGGGGIDLLNPDLVVTQNTTASTITVTTTQKPKYIIVASSRRDSGKISFYIGDIENETVLAYDGNVGNYTRTSDTTPFSSYFSNVSSTGYTAGVTSSSSSMNIHYVYY